MKQINQPLRGIVPPLVTPLLDNDTLDVKGLERLIEHVISGGASAIFLLGTTGEFASLSYKLREQLVLESCKMVNGRVPVLVGIADSAFTESLTLADKAAAHGADAVVITPPYYFESGQQELLEYLKRIMVHMPLPLFIYNMPVHTKVTFAPGTVREIAKIPGIIGIKDSSANLAYFNHVQFLLKDHPEFTFMVGPEEIMPEFVLMGGHGGVNGGANMFPRLYVELYKAAASGDLEKVKQLRQIVMQISTTIYKVGRFGSSYLKGLKCALSVMGICNDFMAEPFHRFNDPERKQIEKALEELNYKSLL
ncbi:dihydrodipicolinate synthase family protein [Sunxiuqinia elliptica]|uniref:4-hydroxy-tetrahydrodipicolinate synthase n=1 Tax=Sunxiuqinia elliptica TaxID=655355 RepID=A0A4R6HB25_9BACT|nr:dihydrodipicolinate synthase family protein [Sunxiuqinia elliptica]TDO05364.1 4-hydroxy-tetrahydrodipicolinate synthase [Sunxiuqinia elliptica]TDO64911.1 4-hydroxy-tetrahydrodipicolinate synthase [Sunxiuqinia elliptica]